MTFRSFSRFVRWYRWELRLAAAMLALAARCDAAFASALLAPAMIAGFRSLDDQLEAWPFRVKERARRLREQVEDSARASLRAMPLRGWTK